MAPTPSTNPPTLAHMIIFYPPLAEIPLSNPPADKDLAEDLHQASQILFYTSHASSGVSRDVMLRQLGLVKGLMSFSGMLDEEETDFHAVHSGNSRMVVVEVEKDVMVYINITLGTKTTPGKPESASTASTPSPLGLSDRMLVEMVKRGYDAFRLLHGRFEDLLPPTPVLSAALDRFWTRWAELFEGTFLSASSVDQLLTWLGGSPAPSFDVKEPIEEYRRYLPEKSTVVLMSPEGPLHTDTTDPSLLRYLHSLVKAVIPRPQIPEGTKSSGWSETLNWVPGLSRSSTPSAPRTPTQANSAKTRWPSLGLGSAVERIGNAMGMDAGPSRSPTTAQPANSQVSRTSLDVPSSPATMQDIEAATAAIDMLGWQSRRVFLFDDSALTQSHLQYVIRDDNLLALISPVPFDPPPDPTRSLFTRVSTLTTQDPPAPTADTTIHHRGSVTEVIGPLDNPGARTLMRLRDQLRYAIPAKRCVLRVRDADEVFARDANGRFFVAKRGKGAGELLMVLGRKDASLTDAEYAVRLFARSHPEFAP